MNKNTWIIVGAVTAAIIAPWMTVATVAGIVVDKKTGLISNTFNKLTGK